MINEPDYDESMNFIRVCSDIPNDKLHSFDNITDAQECKKILESDERYAGRRLKIILVQDL